MGKQKTSSKRYIKVVFKLIFSIMLVLMSIVAHTIYNYLYRKDKNYNLKKNVSFHQRQFATSSPKSDSGKTRRRRIFTYTPNKDYLLIQNFENFLTQSPSIIEDSEDETTNNSKQQMKSIQTEIDLDEIEEELLRNLLLKIKKFAKKINKTHKAKRSKRIIRRNLKTTVRHTKSRKHSHNTSINGKVCQQEKIVNYKPSDEVEKLLNDSRGMRKYLVDYDQLLTTSSHSINNANVSSIQTENFYFEEENEIELLNGLNRRLFDESESVLAKEEPIEDATLAGSSGYLSDF